MNCSVFYIELMCVQTLETKNLPAVSKFLRSLSSPSQGQCQFEKGQTFSPSTPLTASELHITWFGKYSISFGYANVNKDVHDIRNFNMEICGSYVMVFSSSHTYVTR